MAFNIQTEIVIEANPEKVWQVLTDFDQYSDWNPFIKSITGDIAIGNQIIAHIDTMTFKPIVLEFTPNRAFRWRGKLLSNRLFSGEHFFELIDNQNGTTTFIHGENFKGILVPLMKKQLQTSTKAGFIAMNEALKKRVNQLAHS